MKFKIIPLILVMMLHSFWSISASASCLCFAVKQNVAERDCSPVSVHASGDTCLEALEELLGEDTFGSIHYDPKYCRVTQVTALSPANCIKEK